LVASTAASEWRTHRPNILFVEVRVVMATVYLSSSDGRFDVGIAADDAELIASMLLLLEVSSERLVRNIEHARVRACSRPTANREADHVDIVLAS
jgi:hypothetical protein